MKIVSLISGGKDSIFATMQCIAAGHEPIALANLYPLDSSLPEIDSYMYQSIGQEAAPLIAQAMGLPLYRRGTQGLSRWKGRDYYGPVEGDEVEDLHLLLQKVKEKHPEVEGVSVGAILSDYQRVRVEDVCSRLDLTPLAYLWRRDQQELLDEMITCGITAILIKVACLGLEPRHLGMSLCDMRGHLTTIHQRYGVHVCGEGGEYETLTLDCPLFQAGRLVLDGPREVVLHGPDQAIAPVAYLQLRSLRLEPRPISRRHLGLHLMDLGVSMKECDGYVTDHETTEAGDSESDEAERGDSDSPGDGGNEELDGEIGGPAELNLDTVSCAFSRKSGWLWVGGLSTTGDPGEAMRDAMEKLKCILESNGHNLSDLCSITLYVSNLCDWSILNAAYCSCLPPSSPPVRACLQPSNICPTVTLEAISYRPPESPEGPAPKRQVMHVRSRSHWAPQCIGPYSQAIRAGPLVHLAGQIGLVPGSMLMVKSGVPGECRLALRHVARVLDGIETGDTLRDVVQGVCYLTDIRHVQYCRKQWEAHSTNSIIAYVVVAQLPRGALVEWQLWAHQHNHQFEYEETGKRLTSSHSVSIYRRWDTDSNLSVIVSHLEGPPEIRPSEDTWREAMFYTIEKLHQGWREGIPICSLRVFYPIEEGSERYKTLVEMVREMAGEETVRSIVGVKGLHGRGVRMTVMGVRHQ